MFDPNQFLEMQVDQSNDTVLRPIPEGDYIAVATEVGVRPWASKADPSKSGITLDVKWELDDPALKEELGRTLNVKQGVMLDLNEGGTLDMGKGRNVGLGRLREALGLNVNGQPFAFSMIPGRAARVKVKHRQDDNKPDVIYVEVREVASAN